MNAQAGNEVATGHRRVRVWFGRYSIVDQVRPAALADQFAAAMERRFAGLRVTNEVIGR